MRYCSLVLLALAGTTAYLPAQATAGRQISPEDPHPVATLNVDARLVVVPVTVRDKKGALVRTLGKNDFTLAEDGKPQTIRYFDKDNDAPLTLGLLVDVSGSQRDVLDEERTASAAFLDDMLKPDRDKAFIVQFGHQADLLADVTGSLPKLQAGLKKIDADSGRPQFNNTGSDPNDSQAPDSQSGQNDQGGRGRGGQGGGRRHGGGGPGYGGGTVLYDAVFLCSDEVIAKQKSRKALVLLTDGDDRGSKESISSAIEAAQRADASIYAIYFKGEEHGGGGFPGGGFPGGGRRGGFPGAGGGYPGGGRNDGGGNGGGDRERVDGKKILERMADETGGRVFTVSKKEPLPEIYKQIAEELRSQYRLGFTPTDTSEGYHKLLVDLPKDKKDFLQAREGYYTGAPTK